MMQRNLKRILLLVLTGMLLCTGCGGAKGTEAEETETTKHEITQEEIDGLGYVTKHTSRDVIFALVREVSPNSGFLEDGEDVTFTFISNADAATLFGYDAIRGLPTIEKIEMNLSSDGFLENVRFETTIPSGMQEVESKEAAQRKAEKIASNMGLEDKEDIDIGATTSDKAGSKPSFRGEFEIDDIRWSFYFPKSGDRTMTFQMRY